MQSSRLNNEESRGAEGLNYTDDTDTSFTSSVVCEVNMEMLLWIRARISNLYLEESCFSASTIYA